MTPTRPTRSVGACSRTPRSARWPAMSVISAPSWACRSARCWRAAMTPARWPAGWWPRSLRWTARARRSRSPRSAGHAERLIAPRSRLGSVGPAREGRGNRLRDDRVGHGRLGATPSRAACVEHVTARFHPRCGSCTSRAGARAPGSCQRTRTRCSPSSSQTTAMRARGLDPRCT